MEQQETYEQLRLENQLCFPLYAAARKITAAYTPFLKPLDLTYTQYVTLMVLWETDDIRIGELCRRLYLDNGTVTPLVKKMESAGLVTRHRSGEDERCVQVRLTEKGRGLREQVREIPTKVGACIRRLDPEEAGSLYALLYKLLREE